MCGSFWGAALFCPPILHIGIWETVIRIFPEAVSDFNGVAFVYFDFRKHGGYCLPVQAFHALGG